MRVVSCMCVMVKITAFKLFELFKVMTIGSFDCLFCVDLFDCCFVIISFNEKVNFQPIIIGV